MTAAVLLDALECAAMQQIEQMDDDALIDALSTVRDLEWRIMDRWQQLYAVRP